MNPIVFALRHPYTVMVAILAAVLASGLALTRMKIDIFPDLNLPVIYVAQPYGGMDPAQMEGHLTNYYEYHFLYISGIHHVESKSIQGLALMKLYFHPGTNMAQAMAETVGHVDRSRSFMPPGTVPPFIMRFDAGSTPVGFLVFSSDTKTIGQIQDEALFRVRPMFAGLPGVSAPPPFGGNQRTIVIRANPERLRAYGMSADNVVTALNSGNQISPSGTVTIGDKAPIVPVNSVVGDIQELGKIVLRGGNGEGPAVYLRDVGTVEDTTDVATGYGLVNGRRSVYILVTKRADASTLDVVKEVKANLPKMQAVLPEDIKVSFEFDQSPYVTRAMQGVALEALLGAVLTGLMVVLFLRDWRSVIVVVLNIPLALLAAVVGLWVTGQTINLMTLGGLALAVGILVDEATVEVENIHTQLDKTGNVARAVRLGNAETAVPRFLAMACTLAVFIAAFFMEGAARALFVPLSLTVAFAMIASYILSSTFVPVMSVWLLRHYQPTAHAAGRFSFVRFRSAYARFVERLTVFRWLLVLGYPMVSALVIGLAYQQLGLELFPQVDAGQFVLRLRAPDGTPLENTEALAKDVLDAIGQEAGPDNVDISVSLVGTASYNYPINSIFLWTSGPQEAVLRVALKKGSGVRIAQLKEELRKKLPQVVRAKPPSMKDVKFSFEAGDVVAEVMSFGSPTPVEVAISGPSLADNRAYAEKVRKQLERIGALRDLHYGQSLDYPTLEVRIDRERAGLSGVTAAEVANSLAPATLSSRFTRVNYWRDPKSGIGYQVQIEVPAAKMDSAEAVGTMPVQRGPLHPGDRAKGDGNALLVRDVATIKEGTMPGEYDRYNMRRLVSLTANSHGEDLGRVARHIDDAIKAAGAPPRGVLVDVRGQVVPMRQMFRGLAIGLVVSVVVIMLLLIAYFQSIRLALVVMATVPAVVAGVALALLLTGTTLNIQSFMGAIMAIGVAVANAILLITFAERRRAEGARAVAAAVEGGTHRLRPILMTSCAMVAGMLPMAFAVGDGGEQTAPLGRAVIGGLIAATLTTLLILPSVFALVLGKSIAQSVSLDPDDVHSMYYEETN